MDTWIVLIEDRHSDADAHPFSTEAAAFGAALGHVPDGTEPAELNGAMLADGWVLYLPYGPEGDSVRVAKRTMDRR